MHDRVVSNWKNTHFKVFCEQQSSAKIKNKKVNILNLKLCCDLKCSKIGKWWLHNSLNILKSTKLYTLSGWIVYIISQYCCQKIIYYCTPAKYAIVLYNGATII
jgi:hypothetical protein